MRGKTRRCLTVFLALTIMAPIAEAQVSYKFVRQWGSHGTGPEQFGYPAGLAINRHNLLYVVDHDNNRVQRFRLDGTFVSMLGTGGSANGGFDGPSAVAIDTTGAAVVDGKAMSWADTAIRDAAIRQLVNTNLTDKVLNRTEMIAIFKQAGKDGKVSDVEFADLTALANKADLYG